MLAISWDWIWSRLKRSLSSLPSLCSPIVPQKNGWQKETPEDWRETLFSACFKWWEKFWQNKRAHLLVTEKRGNIPLVTANPEWKVLAEFHPPHQHTAPASPGVLWWATDRGSFQTEPYHRTCIYWAWRAEKREDLMIPWPFMGIHGGSVNLDSCDNIRPCASVIFK